MANDSYRAASKQRLRKIFEIIEYNHVLSAFLSHLILPNNLVKYITYPKTFHITRLDVKRLTRYVGGLTQPVNTAFSNYCTLKIP